MDEVFNSDQLKQDIKNKLNHDFPKELIDLNKQQDKQIEQVITIITPLSKSKYFTYLGSRKSNITLEKHLSDIPDGITNFEAWLEETFIKLAKDMFLYLKENMVTDVNFAKLLENQNYEEFIVNSKTKDTNIEQWKGLLEPIFQSSEKNHLAQASACITFSLENAASTLIHNWVQSLWFEDKSIQKVFDDAKAIVAIRNNASKAGKKGAGKRHSLSDKVKEFAINLYLEGNFKNPNQAASHIYLTVIEYGKKIAFSFSSEFQAQKTISDWLRTYKNAHTK
ncbi:MAG: hypothetical protein V7780_02255 [Colwellia sp.]|jgi:hypothetical protein